MPQNKIYNSSMNTMAAAPAPSTVPPISFAGSNAGYSGSRGYAGSAGYVGSASTRPGYTGSVGSGFVGSRGYNGSQGDKGYTGSAGYVGSASTRPGYTGSVGSGFVGSRGYNGSQGEKGYAGSAGATTSQQLTWSYYSTETDLPNASTVHGMFAHVHGTGHGYMAHAGAWIKLANFTDISGSGGTGYTGSAGAGSTGYTGSFSFGFTGSRGYVGSGGTGYAGSIGYAGSAGPTSISAYTRTTISSSATLANDVATAMNITGFKGYTLYKIQTSAAAWVRVYSNAAARSADTTRSSTVDPSSDSGVLAEVITTGSQTVSFAPTVACFNDESPVTTNIPITVTNQSGSSANVTVTLTLLQTEA